MIMKKNCTIAIKSNERKCLQTKNNIVKKHQTISKIRSNKKKSSSKIIENWFTIVVTYFENTQFVFVQKNIINVMNKIIVQFNKKHAKIKKKCFDSSWNHKNNHFFQFFFNFTIKTNFRNWTIVVAIFSTFKIIANKNIEIIIRLNDNEKTTTIESIRNHTYRQRNQHMHYEKKHINQKNSRD